MPSEMFGAPVGIGAAEQDQRENVLGGLNALKMMGEIEAQPGARALTAAHARLWNAEAGAKETEASQMAAIAGATPGAFKGAQSPAEAFARLTAIAGGMGLTKKAGDFAKLTGEIANREQQTATSRSNQLIHEFTLKRNQFKQDGALAASAVDQPSYDRMRMALSSQGKDVSDLPEDYASAKPMLEQLVTASMKASDVLKARERKLVDESLIKQYDARAVASRAAAGASSARAAVSKDLLSRRQKNDGDVSASSAALKKAREADVKAATVARAAAGKARADAQAARDRKGAEPLTPAMIADPEKRVVGQSYKLPTGVFIWGGPELKWQPLNRPVPAASTSPVSEDDEEEEE